MELVGYYFGLTLLWVCIGKLLYTTEREYLTKIYTALMIVGTLLFCFSIFSSITVNYAPRHDVDGSVVYNKMNTNLGN